MQLARAEVYRAIPKLQELGLIQKIVTTPTAFRATPLSEGLSMLLERNAEKHEANCRQAKQFLINFKKHNREKPSQEKSQYYLTSGRAEERELLRSLAETQTSRDGVLDWRGILAMVNRHFEVFKEALERGVKFRYIIHRPEGEKMPQSIQTLTETGSFEIKSVSAVPKAGIDVIDKKGIAIISVPNSNPKEIEVLRSNDAAVVELAQDYFELKWQSATTLVSTKTSKTFEKEQKISSKNSKTSERRRSRNKNTNSSELKAGKD